jgi:hypothetical protein
MQICPTDSRLATTIELSKEFPVLIKDTQKKLLTYLEKSQTNFFFFVNEKIKEMGKKIQTFLDTVFHRLQPLSLNGKKPHIPISETKHAPTNLSRNYKKKYKY